MPTCSATTMAASTLSSFDMMPATTSLTPTSEHAPLTGTNTHSADRLNGERETCGILEGLDDTDLGAFDVWPQRNQRLHHHPFYDSQRIAAQFEADQEAAREFFLPQYKALGAERDDPGALSVYERHRGIERQVANFLYYEVGPYAEAVGFYRDAERIRATALKMYQCRTSGCFGIGTHGKPVMIWDNKCSHPKLCPDESRHDAQRLFDQYADPILEHVRKGGRVYKLWPTLPNYPAGRLREGKRHISKRYRDRFVRTKKFRHVGSLAVGEEPLSADRDWNVHLNVIFLTRGWLSYKNVRAAWGCNIEIREHRLFSEKGMHDLFNEMIKYSVDPVPVKSARKHDSKAPAFTDWTPAEALEWLKAQHGSRRVRSYGSGSLFGIGKPERQNVRFLHALGSVEYHPDGYRVTWRRHNLAYLAKGMLDIGRRDLDLIRGNNSTSARGARQTTGPPGSGP